MIAIEFNNPNAVYFPGQQVAGTVKLDLKKNVKAHSVCIFALGRAHTHWTETQTSTCTVNGKTTTVTRHITYSDTVIYLQAECVPWSSTASCNKLEKGVHVFPFFFILPFECAPSFEGCYGYIRYEIKVEIDRCWNFNKANRHFFSVAPMLDLNSIPSAILPVQDSVIEKTGMVLFRHGKIGMQIRVPKGGFVPGEYIQVEAMIDNASSRPIVQSALKLEQKATFYASSMRDCVGYQIGMPIDRYRNYHKRIEKRCVMEAKNSHTIPPKSKQLVILSLQVPPTISTLTTCPNIDVQYVLKVCFSTSGSVNNHMSTKNAITIGTIPLTQNLIVPVMPSAPSPDNLPYPITSNYNPTVPGIYPSAPPSYVETAEPSNGPNNSVPYSTLPPTYEESVFGSSGTTKDTEGSIAFTPRYPFFPNLGNPDPNAAATMQHTTLGNIS